MLHLFILTICIMCSERNSNNIDFMCEDCSYIPYYDYDICKFLYIYII